jgi:hypothetical protein
MLRRSISVLATLALLVACMYACPQPSLASLGKDYVIVIDVSTSMQDIFEEVKKIAKRTLAEAQTGDNVTVITFGEQAKLLDRKQIRGRTDVESLQAQVDELYPTDYATYLNRGLERGLFELRYLFGKYPDRERVLLWLSDDKDNPPEELGDQVLTIDKLREKNRDLEAQNEWFAYNAPLSEVKNQALEDFVTWARRTTFRVVLKERHIELGTFEDATVEKTILLTFEPKHPGTAGLEFSAEARLADPSDPGKIIPVQLSPNSVVASSHSWQQEFQVAFAGDPGEYRGVLSFESMAGSALDVEPRTVAFTAMIAPPKVAEVEPVEPVEPKREGVLAEAKRKGIIATEDRPPGVTRAEKPLTFGPIEPGSRDSQMITLYLNQEAAPEGITHDLSIRLPEGIDIESKVFGRGKRLAAEIIIIAKQDARFPDEYLTQGGYEGSIRFKSDEAGVEVLPVYVPLRVELNTDRVRWGEKMLPATGMGQVKARGMTFEELSKELERRERETEKVNPLISAVRSAYSRLASRYVFYPVLGAVVVLLIILAYRARPVSELFVGELVVIKDPSNSNMKNVNLRRIGSLQKKDMLTIGNSPKADIRLHHESVSPIHCRISAKTLEGRTDVTILPLKDWPLKVNDIECSEKTRLSDKDLLGIGDFILLFSNPEVQREVVVHFLDGRTMRGTPVTWDISTASFELLRTGAADVEEAGEEITVVNYVDLKAVFFMQDASGVRADIPEEKVNTRELLEVTFFDGEKVEGHPLADHSDVAGRFYIVPREMPNVISILVERNNAKELVKREVQKEPGTARPSGLLGFLRRRKGATPAE